MDSAARNEAAYRARWRGGKRVVQMRPHLWRELAGSLAGGDVLEIGAGLRPTVAHEDSYFADISPEALAVLERRGGRPLDLTHGIPLEDGALRAVFAFEVLEHVDDDLALLSEIARTVERGGLLVCSVPLYARHWSRLDELAAHVRRYEPDDLVAKIRAAGFRIDRVEYRFGRPSAAADRLAAWMLRRLPRLTNLALHRLVFPIQSGLQRRFGRLRWVDPNAPVPPKATGICLAAVRE